MAVRVGLVIGCAVAAAWPAVAVDDAVGNEGAFGPYLSERLYREVKSRDPDRLVVGQDGTYGFHPTNTRRTSDFAGAPISVVPRGTYAPDQPFFFHEYVNSSVKLDSRVADGDFRQANAWNYWLFPVRKPVDGSRVLCAARFAPALSARYPGLRVQDESASAELSSCDAVIAPFGSALEKAALAAGKRVVSLANQDTQRNVTLGWWYMTEQMGAALKDHPVLAGFPHEGLFEPQFFRIGKTGLRLSVKGFAKDDFVMVGEGGKGCYLYLAVAQRPNGARHCLIAGLDVLSDTAEGSAILDGAIF